MFEKNEFIKKPRSIKKAKKYQELIGWPSTSYFYKIVEENQLNICKIKGVDAKQTTDIYGKE